MFRKRSEIAADMNKAINYLFLNNDNLASEVQTPSEFFSKFETCTHIFSWIFKIFFKILIIYYFE